MASSTLIIDYLGEGTLASRPAAPVLPTGGIGYATGAGGTVMQATNKATGVTLNTVSGQITTNNVDTNGVFGSPYDAINGILPGASPIEGGVGPVSGPPVSGLTSNGVNLIVQVTGNFAASDQSIQMLATKVASAATTALRTNAGLKN